MPDPNPIPDPNSWMDAGKAAAPPSPMQPPGAANGAAQQALARAQAPNQAAAAGLEPASTAAANPYIGGQVPLVLRPSRGGLLGVMDKIADALTGTTRPELFHDQDGNEFVYHPNLSRGQQWARIGAGMFKGAAAGLAAGRGAGNMGKAALAGVQVGEQAAEQDKTREEELNKQAQTDMLDRANMTMLRMKTMEEAWRAARLQTTANEEDAKAAQDHIEFLHRMGGEFMGVAQHPGDLAGVLHLDPNLAENFVKNHIIEPVATIDAQGHQGVTFMKMPNADWRKQMVPSGTTFDYFNPATHEIEKHQGSDGQTAGEISDLNVAAAAAKQKYLNDQADLKKKDAETKNLQSETEKRSKMLPGELQQQKAETAKTWAEAHKANMEADAASDKGAGEQGDTESEAQALIDHRSAVSLMNKRAKNYNAVMHRADELSLAQTGHPYDREQGEIEYQNRKGLLKDYTDGQEANSLESFDKFLGHAQEASEAINGLRNKDARLLNIPLNKLETMTGGDRAADIQAAVVKFKTLRNEWETSIKNNHALTVEDIKEGQKLLDENVSLGVGQAVMKAMANTAAVRLRSSDFKYSRTIGKHVPDLLSQEGVNALQHFGIDPKDVYSTLQNKAPQAPVGAVSIGRMTDGKEHYLDAQGKDMGLAPPQ